MLNKIELIGRLAFDPEPRGNNPDNPIAHLRLAVDRDFKREGDPAADFFDVSAFGKQANTLLQYCRKGHMICVVGTLQTREWSDQKTGEKRTGIEIKLSEFHFLEKKEKGAAQESAQRPVQSAPAPTAAPVSASGYVAPPQTFQPQSIPMTQPISAPQPMAAGMPPVQTPAQGYPPYMGYGAPDFSGATNEVPF